MPPRIRTRLNDAVQRLLNERAADDRDDARLQAELLYGEAAGWDRARVIAGGAEVPDFDALVRFGRLLERRLGHEPLAYILGRREFYGLTFEVGSGVLVPRPETETLVEAALAAIGEHPRARRGVRFADIGTGCGAVALSVARHALGAEVFATDSSAEALAYAGRNRDRLDLTERVTLLAGSLIEPLSVSLDVVAANLPYVPTEEYEALPPEIRDGEPREAVDGGEDGLDAIRALARQLPDRLGEGPAAVLLEIGVGQAAAVTDLLLESIGGEARAHRDLHGTRRVIEVRAGY